MTRKELHRFGRVLEDLKADLVYVLHDSLDRLVIAQSADPVDQMRHLTDQELDSQNISLLMTKLRNVEEALRAIHKGTFGRCVFCDCEIPLKRLQAVPWSSSCTACQEAAEAQDGERAAEQPIRSGRALRG